MPHRGGCSPSPPPSHRQTSTKQTQREEVGGGQLTQPRRCRSRTADGWCSRWRGAIVPRRHAPPRCRTSELCSDAGGWQSHVLTLGVTLFPPAWPRSIFCSPSLAFLSFFGAGGKRQTYALDAAFAASLRRQVSALVYPRLCKSDGARSTSATTNMGRAGRACSSLAGC